MSVPPQHPKQNQPYGAAFDPDAPFDPNAPFNPVAPRYGQQQQQNGQGYAQPSPYAQAAPLAPQTPQRSAYAQSAYAQNAHGAQHHSGPLDAPYAHTIEEETKPIWPWVSAGVGVVVLVLIVAVVLAFSGARGNAPTPAASAISSPSPSATQGVSVTLKVQSNGAADISYGSMKNSSKAKDSINGAWSKDVHIPAGQDYFVSVYAHGADSISCSIFVDGKEVDTKSATGSSSSVYCSIPLDVLNQKNKV
ncbi:MAG: MmpS family transport accessory protein [Rothia sp. (in: high G+C Gram-positive bacteria)]|uniref:MmpS family transport accessory protein n=1 Tax=Rothia sp. (in: high G+C Gram-positive bacteria) TaxID=1885016 RepID=UPI0026DEE29B|nr:MmpS family transport accessory protein [Rothia sp. (in: high G+C Gram-positive bacteria)]MDO5749841.1 MmpS family transport accessory protein [Rothia sp. (in: high G+C Gram-positive bacteria)]